MTYPVNLSFYRRHKVNKVIRCKHEDLSLDLLNKNFSSTEL